MEFRSLVEIVDDEPVFETGLLLAGDVKPEHLRRQLSRWTAARRVYQLRRGLYALAPPFQKVQPHPFLLANRMVRGSYVSCQSALAHYSLIPEHVPVVTSVTTGRPGRFDTPLGQFEFRHIKADLFRGYELKRLSGIQQAFIATPEKALLDLLYLNPGTDAVEYLRHLRLQNLECLSLDTLQREAASMGSAKAVRAVRRLIRLLTEDAKDYEPL